MSSTFFQVRHLPARALDSVRTRRILAVGVDFLIVCVLVASVGIALFVVTLGLSLLLLPPLFPIVAFFYNGVSVSGRGMGTPGMRAFDLAVRMNDSGGRVAFLNAAAHGVMFYLSWMFPPVLLVSLIAPDKRCLHDFLAGVVVTRR